MSFHGNQAHVGAKQQAGAQQTLRAPFASFAALGTQTTEEMSVLGLGRQTVTVTQAAGGNPGLYFEVQYRLDSDWLTYRTALVPVPGGPAVTIRLDIAASAMRVIVHNPAGGLSGDVVVRMQANH